MAERRPLVLISGKPRELPSGDTLPGSGGTAQGKIILYKSGADGVQYSTFASANASAVAGDTVIVHAGTYDENDIAKAGVYYYFMPGAVVDYTGVDTTGIISTSGGGNKWYILGNGTFKSVNSKILENIASAPDTLVFEADLVHQTGVLIAMDTLAVNLFLNVKEVIGEGTNGFGVVLLRATKGHAVIKSIKCNTATAGVSAVWFLTGDLTFDIDEISSTQRGFTIAPTSPKINGNIKKITSVTDTVFAGNVGAIGEISGKRWVSSAGRGLSTGNIGGTHDLILNVEYWQSDLSAPYHANGGVWHINSILDSAASGVYGGGWRIQNNTTLYFNGILRCSGGEAIRNQAGTTGSKVYFRGRIEHSHVSTNAIDFNTGTNDVFIQPGSVIISGGTNSISSSVVGKQVHIGIGCVSNKPIGANIVEVGATLHIDSNYNI